MTNMKLYVACLFLSILNSHSQQALGDIEQDEKPNIVYILADDLGYGDLSSFNPEGKITTPHIDELASKGIKFTDAHTSSSVCTPTRYGIITGRYNWRSSLKSGVLTGTSGPLIPKNRTTVASLLKERGYRTAFVGKWHLGWEWGLKDPNLPLGAGWDPSDTDNIDFSKPISHSPRDLGFDYYYSLPASLDMAPYVYVQNDTVTAVPDRVTVNTEKYGWWRKGPTGANFVHRQVTPHFFDKAINYINNNAGAGQPFFLYLALPSPHTPILPNEPWKGKSRLNPYGDFVMEIDHYVGLLLKTIKDMGVEENTLVLFTSDNGCSPEADIGLLKNRGHNPSYIYRGHKADIFEGGHRVPFIAKWPRRIVPGSISDKTICTTDLMATCADITGASLRDDEGEDSFSLLPLFQKATAPLYKRKTTVHHSINGSFAIRKGRWKMIFAPGSGGWSNPKPDAEGIKKLPEFQLYNLLDDPEEQYNQYPEQSAISAELIKTMTAIISDGRSTIGAKQKNDAPQHGENWHQVSNFNY